MTRSDFAELARRIEVRYQGRQAALERATRRWVALGLAGVLLWIGVLLFLGSALFLGGVVAGPETGVWLIGFGVLLIVYGLSQAGLFLLTERARVGGRALRPGEAPALLALLDALRRELRCRRFDDIRLTMAFNAGVREEPRLGLLGWPRTILELGLPLMGLLPLEEFRAILAHELAHISARHGRGGHRLYRLRRTWAVIFERLQSPLTSSLERSRRAAVARFANWYWPRLNARALALSRLQEFQADRISADLAGAEIAARALWRVECLNFWLAERFWDDLRREAATMPEPPGDVLERLRAAAFTPPAVEDVTRWVERALSRTTVPVETHPALGERARALGVNAEALRARGLSTAVQPSAAEVLLGPDLIAIEAELSAEWKRSEAASWRQRHRRTGRPEPAAEPPPPRARDASIADWESACETAELHGLAQAAPLLRSVLERDPGHEGASVALGRHLLETGDPRGERLLLDVIERADEHWVPLACEALRNHYRDIGQPDRYRAMTDRLDRHEAELRKAHAERAKVGPRDRLLPHELDDAALECLRSTLAAHPACESAWLARKALEYFPRRPLFLLCVSAGRRTWLPRDDRADRDLVRQLIPAVELPGQVLVIAANGRFRALGRRIVKRPGSTVYRRDDLQPEQTLS
jgi:Zn-dependent protease with chaperone function